MNFKRILNSLLLVMLSLFILSACSSDSGSGASDKEGNDGYGIDWGSLDWGTDDTDAGSSSSGSSSGSTSGNTGNDSTGDDNTGDDNTGDDNTGDDNTGDGDDSTTGGDGDDDSDSSNPDGDGDGEGDSSNPDGEGDGDVSNPDDDGNSDNEGNTGDGNDNEGTTDDEEEDNTINNAFNVIRLDLQYSTKSGSGSHTADSTSGQDMFYHYDENRLALSYNEQAQTLRVVGKIELAYKRFTNSNYSKLNDLRYRYFDDTISMNAATFNQKFTKNSDGTYKFVYNFVLDGDDKIKYSSSSNYFLSFKLDIDNKTDFPSDVDAFVARDREMIPITAFYDPYSIRGTYEQKGTCTANVYYGDIAKNSSDYTITIDNIKSNIDDSGNLEFTFNLDGFYYTIVGNDSKCITNGNCVQANPWSSGTSIDSYNGSYSLTYDVSSWWKPGDDPLTAGHLSTIKKTTDHGATYNNLKTSITVTDPSGQEETTGDILKLEISRPNYLQVQSNSHYGEMLMTLTCYIQKVSDDVE